MIGYLDEFRWITDPKDVYNYPQYWVDRVLILS